MVSIQIPNVLGVLWIGVVKVVVVINKGIIRDIFTIRSYRDKTWINSILTKGEK